MQRLLGADPDELRAQYLFDLAHTCHCPPPMVDALRYIDFIQLCMAIDLMREQARKQAQQGA